MLVQPTHSPTTPPQFVLNKVDFAVLSDDAHVEYLTFQNRLRAESLPDDPPRTLEAHLARRRNVPPFIELQNWEIRDTSLPNAPIVGLGELQIAHQDENKHVASFQIQVLPERRREGIARRLLPPILSAAQEKGRTLLMAGSTARVPASESFLQRLGATPGLHSHTNQLALSDIDPAALRASRTAAEERCGETFELVYCQSPIPEELLAPAVALGNTVAQDIPIGELAIQQEQFTPEQMREMDNIGLASGARMLAMLVRDKSNGELVALTTMSWRQHTPYLAEQGITGVLPTYRGRGIARYIKVAMLQHLLEHYPDVKFVRTDNADSNAAMLAVNTALGFRPYRSEILWQVPVERVLAYLTA